MGSFHWLIVVPFYFFSALSFLLLTVILARLLRLKIGINPLVITAVVVSLGLVVLPLIVGWATVHDYEGRMMMAIGATSLALAGLDVLLQQWLPLPLDEELEAL